jgi:hypothetical protein
MEIAINFANVLLLSLVIGTMFGIWLGGNPSDFSPDTYVEYEQHLIRALNTRMPILGGTGILLTIASAVLARGNQATVYLLVVAIACLLATAFVTRFRNQPINYQVMTWHTQALPSNWTKLRDNWWRWHILRMLTGIAGLSFVILSMLIKHGVSR